MFILAKKHIVFFTTVSFYFLVLAGLAHASHPYEDKEFNLEAEMLQGKSVKSGDGVSCANDFVVKNKNGDPAEIQIVLGGLPYAREKVPAKGMKMFNLKKNLSIAKLNGKPVRMDDWAFIINAIKTDAPVEVYCSGL